MKLSFMSLEEPEPVPFHPQPDVPTFFHLVEEGSQRRRTKLVDSLGFSYIVRSKVPYATYCMAVYGSPKRKPMQGQCHRACWCVHRAAGQVAHNHSHSVGTYAAAKIISTVKRKAKGMHYLNELAYARKRTRLRRRAVKLLVNLFVGKFGRRRVDRYSISCSLIGKSVVVLKLF